MLVLSREPSVLPGTQGNFVERALCAGLEGWRHTHIQTYPMYHKWLHTHIPSSFRQGSRICTKFLTRSKTKRKRTNSGTQQKAILVFDHLHCPLRARKGTPFTFSPSTGKVSWCPEK